MNTTNHQRGKYTTLFVCFLLLIFTYSATLQYDFAVDDQYRAFRLPESFTRLDEFNTCVSDALPFYFRSGRPIVWISECVERSFVGTISDFYLFRFLPLISSLLLVYIIGTLYSNFSGCRIYVLQMCGLFLSLLPGYQFFVLLGTNGLMVLFAPILSILSTYFYIIRADLSINRYVPSIALYILALYIYPAWALSAVPFSLFLVISHKNNSLTGTVRHSTNAILFYSIGTISYFFSIRLFTALNLFNSSLSQPPAHYDTATFVNPSMIFFKLNLALKYIFLGPVWDVNHIGLFILLIGFISLILSLYPKISIRISEQMSPIICLLIVLIVAIPIYFISIVAPLAPWLLSAMDTLNPRFFNFAFSMPVLCTGLLFNNYLTKNKIIIFASLLLMSSMLIITNKVVTLNVLANAVEIDYMRHQISEWIDTGRYSNDRTVVVIPPYANNSDTRPTFMRSLSLYNESYRTGSWSSPTTHYFELFSALIREKSNHEIDREIRLVNCPLQESNCLFERRNKDSILFYVLNRADLGRQSLNIPTNPLVLDVSSLTANPLDITLSVTPPTWPDLKSSSFNRYDASGLLESTPPGWHSETNPEYPQTLEIDFKQIKSFESVSFLPQHQNFVDRAPKNVRISMSQDGQSWRTIASADNICSANSEGGWHKFTLPSKFASRYLKIDILSNCGDPELITLRGLKFE